MVMYLIQQSSLYLLLLAIWTCLTGCNGQDFLCYSCTYSGTSGDGYECVTSPQNYTDGPNKVSCEGDKVCHIERTVTLFNGQIKTLRRGCGTRVDGCDGDLYEETCTETCTSSLCNDKNVAPVSTTKSSAGGSTTRDPNQFITCYNCDYNVAVDGGNDVCVTRPEDVPDDPPDNPNTARCSAGSLCYIIRTHDIGSKRVELMVRSCGDDFNENDNVCVPNGLGDETCVTTCAQDFCNGGDGIIGAGTVLQSQIMTLIYTYIFGVVIVLNSI